VGVPADDNIPDAQGHNRVLDGGPFAALHGAVRGHNVARIAQDE
jgi:hypothetical protein